MIPDLTRAGPAAIFGMLVALLPMGVAIAYAVKPRERLLALMRPLSLATIFAALHTLVFGLAAVVRHVPAARTPSGYNVDWIAHGMTETLTPVFVAFGCLTVAWLFVALGLRREPNG
jgi:hypothetical protein